MLLVTSVMDHGMKRILLALALVAAVSGCDSMLTRPSLYNNVEVIVTRPNGEPVPMARLELYTGQRPMGYGTTGADGRYLFTDVPRGAYAVLIAGFSEDYDFARTAKGAPVGFTRQFVVDTGSLPPVSLSAFLKSGTITVQLNDAAGPPLKSVVVKLYSGANTLDTTLSDSTGRATFTHVPYGGYGVAVARPLFYRDYRKPGDSAYAFRDSLFIADGTQRPVAIQFQKCAGAVRVIATNELGQPVPKVLAEVYDFDTGYGAFLTDSTGVLVLPAPCAFELGVRMSPPAGYAYPKGRGANFLDGFSVKNGETFDAAFHLQHQP
jgi:hypothetical protein